MAKSPRKRHTLDQLFKKLEALENQVFAQKLVIDELEGQVAQAKETIKKMEEDPFGFGKLTVTPFVQPANPLPQPQYIPHFHVCQPGLTDSAGNTNCTICGNPMNWPYYATNTYTTCSSDPAIQSSSDVELPQELFISLPEETT